MVKEEIFEGLKVALSKGEPLQRAMMSFFNAGYSKEEIEEAARYLQISQAPVQPQYQQQAQPRTAQPSQKPFKQPVQKVSAYEEKPRSTGVVITGILIFLLILLLGVLVAVFLFKDELAAFFGNI